MSLLEALRAITAFPVARGEEGPETLPQCDLDELGDVLDAHGLGPLASYVLESTRLGASAPRALRERLLPLYQGVVNDNVFKLMTLKAALREVEVPVVLLGGAALLDWVYPHLAFRPVGELRLAVKGTDGRRFAEALARRGFGEAREGDGGHTARFGDGRLELAIQEGLVAGRADDHGLFQRAVPFPAVSPAASRLSAADALLYTVGELALAGLHAPLILYVDLRELLLLPELQGVPAREELTARAGRAGLARALHGACALVSRFFPEVASAAAALSPPLGAAERLAVRAVVESAGDPARLRLRRGAEAAARALLAPSD